MAKSIMSRECFRNDMVDQISRICLRMMIISTCPLKNERGADNELKAS
jgi:hypothetical protein